MIFLLIIRFFRCSISKTTLLCLNEQGQTVVVDLTQTSNANVENNLSIDVPGSDRLYDIRASPYTELASFIVSTADKNIFFANNNQSNFDLIESISVKGDVYIQLLDLGATILEITVEPVSKVSTRSNDCIFVSNSVICGLSVD